MLVRFIFKKNKNKINVLEMRRFIFLSKIQREKVLLDSLQFLINASNHLIKKNIFEFIFVFFSLSYKIKKIISLSFFVYIKEHLSFEYYTSKNI